MLSSIRTIVAIFSTLLIVNCQSPSTSSTSEADPGKRIEVSKAAQAPKLDGYAYDACWKNIDWLPINQRWLGEPYSPEDFSGHYKMTWHGDQLYLLVEIVDDAFVDNITNPLERYWDDDCLEIFIDEDASGGNHQYNHNAFAYHIAKNGDVLDIGPDSVAHFYNQNLYSVYTHNANIYTWEVAMYIFDDTFQDGSTANTPVKLAEGKEMGFAIAYCDNDFSKERENFIGSVVVEGEDKNRGWIDAGIFGRITLK